MKVRELLNLLNYPYLLDLPIGIDLVNSDADANIEGIKKYNTRISLIPTEDLKKQSNFLFKEYYKSKRSH